MKAKRRRHDATFKSRVALEALKGEKTIQQIAADYEVHPVQVSDWKKILIERLPEAFEGKKGGCEERWETRPRHKCMSAPGNPPSQKWGKPHENDSRKPPPPSAIRFFAPPLQARAGLVATLRGQPGLALQSKKLGDPFQTEVDPSRTNA